MECRPQESAADFRNRTFQFQILKSYHFFYILKIDVLFIFVGGWSSIDFVDSFADILRSWREGLYGCFKRIVKAFSLVFRSELFAENENGLAWGCSDDIALERSISRRWRLTLKLSCLTLEGLVLAVCTGVGSKCTFVRWDLRHGCRVNFVGGVLKAGV
jgi:hypothetical protein